MLISHNPEIIREAMKRVQSELNDKELPLHRKWEVESALYYLKEDLRYLDTKREKE